METSSKKQSSSNRTTRRVTESIAGSRPLRPVISTFLDGDDPAVGKAAGLHVELPYLKKKTLLLIALVLWRNFYWASPPLLQ